jgi:excisionase family DNA binding protein
MLEGLCGPYKKGRQAQNSGAVPMKHDTPNARPTGEHFLTLCEAADVLGLNPRTIREYVRRKELKGRIIGRRWRFRREDLDAFFESAPRDWDFAGKHVDES